MSASRVRWHRLPIHGWYAEINGIKVAEAYNTSQTGTEDYPWDWWYTDEGAALRSPTYAKVPTSGVHDTLGSVKRMVQEQIGGH